MNGTSQNTSHNRESLFYHTIIWEGWDVLLRHIERTPIGMQLTYYVLRFSYERIHFVRCIRFYSLNNSMVMLLHLEKTGVFLGSWSKCVITLIFILSLTSKPFWILHCAKTHCSATSFSACPYTLFGTKSFSFHIHCILWYTSYAFMSYDPIHQILMTILFIISGSWKLIGVHRFRPNSGNSKSRHLRKVSNLNAKKKRSDPFGDDFEYEITYPKVPLHAHLRVLTDILGRCT